MQAFAEYFNETQLTNLVLTAMEELTGSRAKVSLAAAQLMSAVMKERGTDMIKVVWCCGGSSAPSVRSPGSSPGSVTNQPQGPGPVPLLSWLSFIHFYNAGSQ